MYSEWMGHVFDICAYAEICSLSTGRILDSCTPYMCFNTI